MGHDKQADLPDDDHEGQVIKQFEPRRRAMSTLARAELRAPRPASMGTTARPRHHSITVIVLLQLDDPLTWPDASAGYLPAQSLSGQTGLLGHSPSCGAPPCPPRARTQGHPRRFTVGHGATGIALDLCGRRSCGLGRLLCKQVIIGYASAGLARPRAAICRADQVAARNTAPGRARPADYHRSVAMTHGPAGRAGPGAAVPAVDACCEECAPAATANPDERWLRNARYARWLAWASLGWMAAEGAAGLIAGLAAGSIALVGWALGSGIEALASVIVVWRFTGSRMLSESAERRAQRAVAVSFWLLAPYIAIEAIHDLAAHHPAAATPVGIVLTASSLVIMPVLGIAKRRLGERLDSGATAGEGTQNLLCAAQAAGVLLALVVVAVWPGGWPIDPIIALGVAAWSAWEGNRAWRGANCC